MHTQPVYWSFPAESLGFCRRKALITLVLKKRGGHYGVYVSDSEGKQHTTKTVGSQLETTNSLDGYALASKENEKNTEFCS